MKVKKEFILDEEDIKEAIKDYLYCEVEDRDKVSVVLNATTKIDIKGIPCFEIIAICKEEIDNA